RRRKYARVRTSRRSGVRSRHAYERHHRQARRFGLVDVRYVPNAGARLRRKAALVSIGARRLDNRRAIGHALHDVIDPPAARFSKRASAYAANRPGYPPAALDALLEGLG